MATKRDFTTTYGLQSDKSGAGTNTLVVDSVNDRVGIATGASAPVATLDVNGDALINGLILGRSAGNISTNVAFGATALDSNTTGFSNVGIGASALTANLGGTYNTAVGNQALISNTSGTNNTAVGDQALFQNTTGQLNTGIGSYALKNTTGGSNVALGYYSGVTNTSGTNSVYLGSHTGVTTTTSRKIIIGSGTSNAQLFDAPDTTNSTQLAIGHNVSGTTSYWIVGDENYNIALGATDPNYKLDVGGDTRIRSTNKLRFGGTTATTNFYIQYNSTTNSLDFVAG